MNHLIVSFLDGNNISLDKRIMVFLNRHKMNNRDIKKSKSTSSPLGPSIMTSRLFVLATLEEYFCA